MAERNLAVRFQIGQQLMAGAIGIFVGAVAFDLAGMRLAVALEAICGFAGVVVCERVMRRFRGPHG